MRSALGVRATMATTINGMVTQLKEITISSLRLQAVLDNGRRWEKKRESNHYIRQM